MQEATATLITHSGAYAVTRDQLRALPTPESTPTHKTVPHYHLIDTIETALNDRGVFVAKQQFAVQGEFGAKMFGVLTLKKADKPDFSYAIGVRAANDKTLAIKLVSGGRVFVCDNLMLSGDSITLNRKHTSGLDIEREIEAGVGRALGKFVVLDTRINELKARQISDAAAKAKVVDAIMAGVIPAKLLGDVVTEYLDPTHSEFKPKTAWSCYNAFTHVLKVPRVSANVAFQSTLRLGKFFNL